MMFGEFLEKSVCPYRETNIAINWFITLLPEYMQILFFVADFLPFGRLLLWGHGLESFAPHMLGDCFYLMVFYRIYRLGYLPGPGAKEEPKLPRWFPYFKRQGGRTTYPVDILLFFPGLIIANVWSIYCKWYVFSEFNNIYFHEDSSFVPVVFWTLFETFARYRVGILILKSVPTIKKSYSKFAIPVFPLIAAWFLAGNWNNAVSGAAHLRICPLGVPERSFKFAAMADAYNTAHETMTTQRQRGQIFSMSYLPLTVLLRWQFALTYQSPAAYFSDLLETDESLSEIREAFQQAQAAVEAMKKTTMNSLMDAAVNAFAGSKK